MDCLRTEKLDHCIEMPAVPVSSLYSTLMSWYVPAVRSAFTLSSISPSLDDGDDGDDGDDDDDDDDEGDELRYPKIVTTPFTFHQHQQHIMPIIIR